MAEIVRMPKMSDTMTEGVIAKWHKKVGDTVKSGELMAEIETDKATMDYESFNAGTILFLGAEEGQAVQVNDVLAIVGNSGEDYKALLASAGTAAQTGGKAEEPKSTEPKSTEPKSTEPKSTEPKSTEPKSTPAPAKEAAPAMDTSGIKAEIVLMPKMSDTMTEGVIAAWHKKVGDAVKNNELLAEIETDKATMEYESYNTGTLLYIGAEPGKAVPVNGVLAIIGEKGADWETLLKAHQSKGQGPAETPEAKTEAAPAEAGKNQEPVTVEHAGGRVKASPLAKKLAKDKGIDVAKIQGSGDHGRVTKRDVENYKPTAEPPAAQKGAAVPVAVGQESFEEVNVTQMRKAIARRLGEIKFSAIEIFLTMEINMDKAIEARNSINEVAPVKVSFNDMVIKAVAAALKTNPKVNSSWLGDKIRYNHHVHIGVAVAVDEGLLVPVIRFADSLGLAQISASVKDLAGKAKNKKLQPAEMEGSTFTVSNLGMFGIEQFTAVINSPNACILAIGGIKQTAIVKNGQLVPGNVMNVTLTCDHRVVDGAVGAAFLQSLKGLLEDPVRILI
jgi:pyruvate dehydrogenase E2 component (dihydrolipoamide acetyltransferase)